jgi:hypothetical protein
MRSGKHTGCATLEDPATTNVERRIEMNEIPRVIRLHREMDS